MLFGKSGIGKSECALELVAQGHRFVADDLVKIEKTPEDRLIVQSVRAGVGRFINIRGIGIVDVKKIYGDAFVLSQTALDLVIELSDNSDLAIYEVDGIEPQTTEILGLAVPKVILPVQDRKNLTRLVVLAVQNERCRLEGSSGKMEFSQLLKNPLSSV